MRDLDEWKKYDSMEKHIQPFDVTIGNLNGIPSSLCVHNPLCGHSGAWKRMRCFIPVSICVSC